MLLYNIFIVSIHLSRGICLTELKKIKNNNSLKNKHMHLLTLIIKLHTSNAVPNNVTIYFKLYLNEDHEFLLLCSTTTFFINL